MHVWFLDTLVIDCAAGCMYDRLWACMIVCALPCILRVLFWRRIWVLECAARACVGAGGEKGLFPLLGPARAARFAI